jgi:hypothetical protein
MRETSKKSEDIIALLKTGKKQVELFNLGYPESTVRYYYRKLFKPSKHKRFVKQVSKYNKNAIDKVL